MTTRLELSGVHTLYATSHILFVVSLVAVWNSVRVRGASKLPD